MADIVPDLESTRCHWTVQLDTAASDQVTLNKKLPLAGLRHLTFYFADVDNAEVFKSPPGTVACAWQPVTNGDLATVNLLSTGIVFGSGANTLGWLHVLCRGTVSTGTSTIDAPVARGTAGHVQPERSMFLSHRAASPNTLTSGKHVNKHGLRMRVFQFTTTANADVWKCESLRLCPGIVAVAWSGNSTEDVSPTQSAAGDVIFNSTAGSADFGWLWTWSRH